MSGIGVVPPGGFTYFESGMKEPLEASGEVELIDKLLGYRIANHQPIGNPERDVQAYIAKSIYRPKDPEPFQPLPPSAPQTLRDRVTQYLSERFLRAGSLQLVSDEEAERRAAICVNCPRNQNWKHGCPPCIANNERVILLLTQGRLTSKTEELGGCESFGHENNCAVRLELEDTPYTLTPPTNCWKL